MLSLNDKNNIIICLSRNIIVGLIVTKVTPEAHVLCKSTPTQLHFLIFLMKIHEPHVVTPCVKETYFAMLSLGRENVKLLPSWYWRAMIGIIHSSIVHMRRPLLDGNVDMTCHSLWGVWRLTNFAFFMELGCSHDVVVVFNGFVTKRV